MKLKQTGAVTAALLTVCLTAVFIFVHQPSSLARQDKQPAPGTRNDANPNSPAATTNDPNLAREIDRIFNENDLQRARFGVFVISPQDGRVLYARNADQLFTPASNMKVYTTAVALDLLGPDYRWRTSVYANKQPDANGIVNGDLTLYGRGAPDLLSKSKGDAPSLTKLAD